MNFSEFEKSIDVNFSDKALLKQAFTHRSYLNENRKTNLEHNERLEFLGDAVLELIVTDHLYEKYLGENLFPLLPKIIKEGFWMDAKSRFQEKAQEIVGVTPSYETLKEIGPDHDKHFTLGVFLGKEKIAEGEGKSKQDAEQAAARAGLQIKKWN